ncbi:tyrosinase-like protein 1 [Argopecten irradians]|uniref:tyrosinase-like protein 1 n=1 Tax=Argopecten irradians TaxID=31199 RepID=UPI00371A0552
MKPATGLLITGISILFIRGQYQYSISRDRKCQQYIGSHGNIEITQEDDSVFCFHQHLYQSALDASPTDAMLLYIRELLWKSLSRCHGNGSEEWRQWLTKEKVCNNGTCRMEERRINICKKGQNESKTKATTSKGCRMNNADNGNSNNTCEVRRTNHTKAEKKAHHCSWIRKEVRAMNRSEWTQFVNRLNILKEAIPVRGHRSFVPYDVISDLHRSNESLHSSHGGPNFLGWHRMYLLLLEAAIGVPIPYWDSRLDYDMTDPTDSILWTSEFFGPGFGLEDSGPFANWKTPDNESLVRNIGNNGSLVSSDMVKTILRYRRHSRAVEPILNSIEDIHEGPHRWVDGQMSSLETAPQDPIFFLHHSFIDYIWYMFRKKLRKRGEINPALDYPCKGPESHHSYATMFPYGNLPNIYGYSDHLESLTHYVPSPKCPDCGNSAYLYCDHGIRRCKSKAVTAQTSNIRNEKIKKIRYRIRAIGIIHLGRKFELHIIDQRTRGDTLTFLPLIDRVVNV